MNLDQVINQATAKAIMLDVAKNNGKEPIALPNCVLSLELLRQLMSEAWNV